MQEITTEAKPTLAGKPPIFTCIAGLMVLVCLTTPIIMLSTPVAITTAAAVVALFRKEQHRWVAAGALVIAVLVMFAGSSRLDQGTSTADLQQVELVDWSWEIDPTFGSEGIVRWRVEVRNRSDRAMESVKVDFSTFDETGGLLSSDSTFVDAIPPGETRMSESFSDRYGTESTAQAAVGRVRYSGED